MNELVKKFIIALVISLLVFGISAAVIVSALSIGRESENTDDGRDEEILGESFNVLLIMTDFSPNKFGDYLPEHVKNVFGIDYKTNYSSDSLDGYRRIYAETMALFRFDAERGEITYTHIPGNTLVSVKGVKMCLEEIPSRYGAEFLVEKIHALFGVEIDTYALFTPKSAATALSYVGNIIYTVDKDMHHTDSDRGIDIHIVGGAQEFDGKKAVDLLRFDNYSNNGSTKSATVCGYLKRFVNKLSEDFTYDEIGCIIKKAFEVENIVTNFESNDMSKYEESIRLLSCGSKLEVIELLPVGEEQRVDSKTYFKLNESETLKRFAPYRKINSPK